MDARDDAVEEELIKHVLIFSKKKKKKKLSTFSYTKNVDCNDVVKEEFEAEKRTRKVKGQRGCIDVIRPH